jgi:hypothetical protein
VREKCECFNRACKLLELSLMLSNSRYPSAGDAHSPNGLFISCEMEIWRGSGRNGHQSITGGGIFPSGGK